MGTIFATVDVKCPLPAKSSKKTTFGEEEDEDLLCFVGGEEAGGAGEHERLREEEDANGACVGVGAFTSPEGAPPSGTHADPQAQFLPRFLPLPRPLPLFAGFGQSLATWPFLPQFQQGPRTSLGFCAAGCC